MIGLDRLMKIKGVVAAGQFDEKGNIVRSEGNIKEDMKGMIAKAASNISELIGQESKSLEEVGGSEWKGLNGWAFWSGKYSLCVINKTGVIVETSKANFNDVLISLLGEGPTGAKPMNY